MTYAIARPDQGIAAALQQRIDTKTKPLGALGRLEALAPADRPDQQTLSPALRSRRCWSSRATTARRRPACRPTPGRDLADGRELPCWRRGDQRLRAARWAWA